MSFQEERGSGVYNNRTYDVLGNTRPTSISIPSEPAGYDEEQVSPLSEHGSDLSRAFSDRTVSNPNSHVVSIVGPAATPAAEHDDSDDRSTGGDREAQPGDNLVSHFREHDQTETRLVEEPSVEKSGYAALGEHKRESWATRMLKSRKRCLIIGLLVLIIFLLVVLVPVLVVTLRNRNNRGGAGRSPGIVQPKPTEPPGIPEWAEPPDVNGNGNGVLWLTGLSQSSGPGENTQTLFYQAGDGTVKILELSDDASEWNLRSEYLNTQNISPGSPLAVLSNFSGMRTDVLFYIDNQGTIKGVKPEDTGPELSSTSTVYPSHDLEQPHKRQNELPDGGNDLQANTPISILSESTAQTVNPTTTESPTTAGPSGLAALSPQSVLFSSSAAHTPEPTMTWEAYDIPEGLNTPVPTFRNTPLVVKDGVQHCQASSQERGAEDDDISPLTIFTTGKDRSLRQYVISAKGFFGVDSSIRVRSPKTIPAIKGTAGLAWSSTNDGVPYLVGHSDNKDQSGLVLLTQSGQDESCEWVPSESSPPDIEVLTDGILCAVNDFVVHQRNDGSIWGERLKPRENRLEVQGESGKSLVTWVGSNSSVRIVSRDKEVVNGTGLACGTTGDFLNHYVVYQNQDGNLKQAFWNATNTQSDSPPENDVGPRH